MAATVMGEKGRAKFGGEGKRAALAGLEAPREDVGRRIHHGAPQGRRGECPDGRLLHDVGLAAYERQHHDRVIRNLAKRAAPHGYKLVRVSEETPADAT